MSKGEAYGSVFFLIRYITTFLIFACNVDINNNIDRILNKGDGFELVSEAKHVASL